MDDSYLIVAYTKTGVYSRLCWIMWVLSIEHGYGIQEFCLVDDCLGNQPAIPTIYGNYICHFLTNQLCFKGINRKLC